MSKSVLYSVAALALVGLLIAWGWRGAGKNTLPVAPLAAAASQAQPQAAAPPTGSSVQAPAVSSVPPVEKAVTAARSPSSRQPYTPPSPEREAAESIALNLRHFGQRFGGNPVGTNAEIVRALNGGNEQGARYLPQEHLHLNEQGELLDSYGTPYFFHQISSQEMEVRSAGPDKTLWTSDDIAVK